MLKNSPHLKKYIDYLGLPNGVFPAIDEIYRAMDGRIWMIDNSSAMRELDSHLTRSAPDFEWIEKRDGVSRWSELTQCIEFHAKMASRCWIPTQFRLLNEPEGMPRKFTVCWGHPDDVSREREFLLNNLQHVRLESRINPLAKQMRKLSRYLSRDSVILRAKDEYVSVIICTQGIPTDEHGNYDRYVLKEFVDSLAELAALPVKIVFRLTTDDDKVLEFFGSLDTKYDCDVLDDFWGEAMEIYLHNPWLTYGIGIHRLREAGLGTEMMDNLDEKPFNLEEIRAFSIEFFVGRKGALSIRNPKVDISGFFEDLQKIVDKEKPVWNPLKNRPTPWIDVEKLKLMVYRKSATSSPTPPRKMPMIRRATTMDPPEKSSFAGHSRSSSFHNKPSQATNGSKDHLFYRKGSMHSFHEAPSRVSSDRRTNYTRSSSYNSRTKTTGATPSENGRSEATNLDEAIQHWSRQAPDYKKLKPLEVLLVDVPKLFPPKNSFVESHEHFFKWKEFSEDAFIGESGDGLKALLKRASRKSKLFFHPDKLPSDMTPNQEKLFKSMWDVIQESEADTL